jgi:peroxiredoxin Q/BCP
MPQVGDLAPDFRAPGHDGEEIALADYRGRRVLLFFFVKANTSG